MIRRPPRSTRTDTLFPYTTLFRSSMFMVQAKINQIILTFTGLKGRFPVDEAGCPVILAINPEWRKCCNITRMLTIFTKLFGKKSDKDVKELLPLFQKFNEEYGKLSPSSNYELKATTQPFKPPMD